MFINILFKIMVCLYLAAGTSICMDTPHIHSKPQISLESKIVAHHDEPAFFRFQTDKGRIIYLLGTHHFVPLKHFFGPNTLKEFHSIAHSGAIFYSEHDITNTINLEYLKDEENLIPHEAFLDGNTLFTMPGVDIKLDQNEKILLYDTKLMLDLGHPSDINFSDVLKARLWLGAVILGTHASILSYKMFGGTEQDLIQGEFEGKWKAIKELEQPKDVVEIMKSNRNNDEDTQQNMIWLKKSIDKLLIISKKNELSIKAEIEEQYDASTKSYPGWKVVLNEGKGIPKSVFARNKHWVSTLLHQLEDGDKTSLFIVVGNGHFAGGKQSFLSLLLYNTHGSNLERFDNKRGWVKFHY